MRDLEWIKTTLIAHRGLHTLDQIIPENTLIAFEKAMEKGYGIEFDVNVLKDGTIVCFHDKDLNRLCGVNEYLKNVTFEEIKDLTILKSAQKIPTLKTVLDFIDAKVPLLIELKPYGNFETLCSNFVDTMKDYKGVWAMHSFHPSILMWFKKHHPEIVRGQITEYFTDDLTIKKTTKFLMKRMALNFLTKPDFINYGMKDMPNRFIDRQMKKGRVVIGYASTTQEQFDWMKAHYHNSVFEYFEPKNRP
ncbi:MAG: glycerophosphodiester phosphodiesterase [Firmicutes bacterium]|nr:glycerophosphodiester phosphodiesterase [Bacillota bacterium]